MINRVFITGILLYIFVFLISCSDFKESLIRYKIDNDLDRIFESDMPGAAIIAVKNDRIVYRNSFGLANVELNVSMEPGMCFKTGSISKQFTGAAILLLEEQGLLSIEDAMLKYLPGYPAAYKDVKIKHLLSHTSGIKNYPGNNNGLETIQNRCTQKELVDIMLTKPLNFNPGDKWEYSNSNYTILAYIIEQLTGDDYHNYIIENIFQPCGMISTFFADDESVIPGLVTGYRVDNEKLKTAEYMSMTHTFGAGDIISCVDDMAKWNKAFLSGKIISQGNLTKCFTPTTLYDGSQTNYGIGWFIDNYRNITSYYHDGGVYGFQSLCTYIADMDLYIVILRNRSDVYLEYPPNLICNMIADIILGYKNESNVRIAVELTDEQLEKYTGIYQFVESPGIRKISLVEGRLYYERPPRKGNEWSKNEIKPESVYSFFAEGKKSTITFEFNKKDEVVGMNVNQDFGRVVKLKKLNK